MTFLRIVIPLYLFFEHDLRANAFGVCCEGNRYPLFQIMLLQTACSPQTLWCGRCLDPDYWTTSPCNARSSPSRSVFTETRRPTTILTTERMIKLTTAS